MRKTPSLDDLARFRRVIERGSFVAAARDLGIPKSTLSKAIARLESDLGVRLLERTTRNMRPTEIGRVVAAHCKEMVEAFEAARAAASATDVPSGRLRVSCPPGLLANLVEDIVLEFLEAFPRADIDLQVSSRPFDVIRDNVDIALRARTRLEAGASFVTRRLGTSRGMLVAAPAILRDSTPVTSPGDLATLPTLGMAGDGTSWRFFDANGLPHDVTVAPRLVTSNVETLRRAAIRGLGVAQLPEHVCEDGLASGRLERVLPDYSTIGGTVYAVFSRESARLPLMRTFIDRVGHGFRSLSIFQGERMT